MGMKGTFRHIVSQIETEDEAVMEAIERRAPPLPKRKHSDYPPPKVYGWQPSEWIQPPGQERLRARR
jgi:hypothetical protein